MLSTFFRNTVLLLSTVVSATVTKQPRDFFINTYTYDATITKPLTDPSAAFTQVFGGIASMVIEKGPAWANSVVSVEEEAAKFFATQTAISIPSEVLATEIMTVYTEAPDWYTKLPDKVHDALEFQNGVRHEVMEKTLEKLQDNGALGNVVGVEAGIIATALACLALL
ncbi:hypothetical protein BU23DRAFT_574851 [Bimuria novae-zelandiae CBS 107.79]|uniref:EthD domain-containing protein n=1 Tax=Bimuria novae-zelandiae CBS 107.79 TaxID=1447943 RepID=A0A6A5UL87_9PLEO|nr:hypothetical protein BU23DRAFT_574851 [Bimuria novae-zelandiae CBS 107.79]